LIIILQHFIIKQLFNPPSADDKHNKIISNQLLFC